MFGMFQRRNERAQAVGASTRREPVAHGDQLVSFIGMNLGDRGLSIREKLATAHRIEAASPLDNPMSALDANAPVHEIVQMTPVPAFFPVVNAPATQPLARQPGAAIGGMTW